MADRINRELGEIGKFIDRGENKNRIFAETVFKRTGIKLGADEWRWRDRAVFLKVSPLKKTEIILKSREILAELEGQLGRSAPLRLK